MLWRTAFLAAFLAHGGVAQSIYYSQFDTDAVRATYDKLVFASRLKPILDDEASPAAGDGLSFTLSQIKAGPLSDITGAKASDLITMHGGLTLEVTPGSWSLTTGDKRQLNAQVASVGWKQYPDSPVEVSLGQFLTLTAGHEDGRYSRYVSFSVTVSYAGQQRSYRALFLFGEDQTGQQLFLRPIDNIVPDIGNFMASSAIPEPLANDIYRSNAEAKSHIQSLRGVPGCRVEPRTKMCCDAESGHCAVDPASLDAFGFGPGADR